MEIRAYNRLQLQKFIDSDFFRKLDKIPISYLRAVSHIHNPDCSDEDEILWAMYKDNSLVGYLGAIPGKAHINGKDEKFAWASCIWLNPNYRKMGLLQKLFETMDERYSRKIMITNLVSFLIPVYYGYGQFQEVTYKDGYRIYARCCLADVLPIRNPKTRFFKPLLQLTDLLVNILTSCFKKFSRTQKIACKIVNDTNFDSEFQKLLDNFRHGKNYIRKDIAHFQWIMNYPWLIQGTNNAESARYYFSSVTKRFDYDSLKFYKNGKLVGYALLKVRDKDLTVSCTYMQKEDLNDLASYIWKKMKNEKLNTIITTDIPLSKILLHSRLRYVFAKRQKRPYLIAQGLDITAEDFQKDDGDNIFT
jgi:GNAT superfamily N-acetyltransferase